MLRLNPQERPSCPDILSYILLKSTGKKTATPRISKDSLQDHLLQTIRVPQDLRFLQSELPASNYSKSYQGALPSIGGRKEISLPYIQVMNKKIASKQTKRGPVSYSYDYAALGKLPSIGPQIVVTGGRAQPVRKEYSKPDWWG